MRSEDERGRGSATVEFALVLPFVLLLVLALVQVGLLARDHLLLTQAARAVAREAAVTPDDEAAKAAGLAAAPALDPTALETTVVRTGGRGDPVVATLRYAASVQVPLVEALLPSSVVLTATVSVRQEFAP